MADATLIRVDDLPTALAEACIERGRSRDDMLTAREAVAEWSGWHIEDRFWGTNAVDLYLMALESVPATPAER